MLLYDYSRIDLPFLLLMDIYVFSNFFAITSNASVNILIHRSQGRCSCTSYCQLLSKVIGSIYTSASSVWACPWFHFLATIEIINPFNVASFMGAKWYLDIALICIFLNTIYIMHFHICWPVLVFYLVMYLIICFVYY